jgi:hypothetical protein
LIDHNWSSFQKGYPTSLIVGRGQWLGHNSGRLGILGLRLRPSIRLLPVRIFETKNPEK